MFPTASKGSEEGSSIGVSSTHSSFGSFLDKALPVKEPRRAGLDKGFEFFDFLVRRTLKKEREKKLTTTEQEIMPPNISHARSMVRAREKESSKACKL